MFQKLFVFVMLVGVSILMATLIGVVVKTGDRSNPVPATDYSVYEELEMFEVVCGGCGTSWHSSDPEPIDECHYCEETFCDEGLMIVATVAMMQPNGPPTDPRAIAKIDELMAKFEAHAEHCEQCQKMMR